MNAKTIGLGILDAIVKIVFVIVMIMLISKYSKLAYSYGYHIFNQQPVSSGTGRTVNFTVNKGDSVNTIADNLASVGLITDTTLFKLQERFSEYHGQEQPGTYELSTSMTPEEMISLMAGGGDSSESGAAASGSTGTESAPSGENSDAAVEVTNGG
ncbi:MAG: endolytic transglycosylase MltG [Butyrivibrio sp.]|nr:endolytic transglycosylase MltG [Butyrivibrio sp.]